MRIIVRAIAIARALFRGRQVDADLADEMRFHIDREAEANVARGMSPEEAHRQARLTFGSVDVAIETSRDERPGAMLRQIARDARFGLRLLARAPGFGAAAIVTVGLGLGAVTGIFSVVYGVMLRPLPFREPDRLVSIWSTRTSIDGARLYPTAADAVDWRTANHVFDDIALVRTTANLNLVGSGEPERLAAARLAPNVFTVLGVAPAIGRSFAADEDRPGRDQVVLLSDGLWRRRFAADPAVVGRTVQLNGLSYTVIGVMPPDFQYPSREYQAWVPLVIMPRELTRQETENYLVVARLRRGATLATAQNDLSAIADRIANLHPDSNRRSGVLVESMLGSAVRGVRPALIALLAASGCLLLIACLNLSNLLGARAMARGGEFAVRLALGASRQRLISQAVAEVVPLLAIGGAIGIAAAAVGVRAFVVAAPAGMPRVESVGLSAPVILVSLVVLVVTGLFASAAPTMHAIRHDFSAMTNDGGRSATTGQRRGRARRLGVAAQITVALPLLVGATLLVRSAINLAGVELGFRPAHVATFQLAVPRTKYSSDADVAAFYDRLLGAVRAVPDVSKAGMVNRLPLAGNQTMSIDVERSPGDIAHVSSIDSRPITPDYFAALGIAIRAGRPFTERDMPDTPGVAIVDEWLARAMWPGQSTLGKRVRRFDGVWCSVVGVVAHIHASGVDTDPRPQIYWSHHQVTQDRMVLVVRAHGEALGVVQPVIQAIHALDPDQPVYEVRTMERVVERSMGQRRLTMTLIAAFGAIALVLAAVGVYGVVAYSVTTRVREFGIRAALGATPAAITGAVVREGTSMALWGTSIGLAASLGLGGVMSTLVFGVDPRDYVSLGLASLTLLLVAAIASYVPARRASAVHPAESLRAG